MLKRNTLKKIAVCALWVGAAGIFSACSPKGPKFQGVDLTGAEYGRDLPLTDQFGKERSIKDFAGKVVVVFFGYTQCPDVCPTSMSELAEVKRSLGADGDKLQGIFVTVDPERDTPALLRDYMAAFDTRFLALVGSPEQTKATADEFRVFYKKVPTGSTYTMDHTALSYLFDPQGRFRVVLRHEQTANDYAADIRNLLTQP